MEPLSHAVNEVRSGPGSKIETGKLVLAGLALVVSVLSHVLGRTGDPPLIRLALQGPLLVYVMASLVVLASILGRFQGYGRRWVNVSSILLCSISVLLSLGLCPSLSFFYEAQATACGRNMDMVQSAKLLWASQHAATNGQAVSWEDLEAFMGTGRPGCPGGGVYTIGPVGGTPECSVRDHTKDWEFRHRKPPRGGPGSSLVAP